MEFWVCMQLVVFQYHTGGLKSLQRQSTATAPKNSLTSCKIGKNDKREEGYAKRFESAPWNRSAVPDENGNQSRSHFGD